LTGALPGYVGHDDGSHAVFPDAAVLFDEADKA
jgi:ATP-dependent Clp protease ATP-binding subunit ClpA